MVWRKISWLIFILVNEATELRNMAMPLILENLIFPNVNRDKNIFEIITNLN